MKLLIPVINLLVVTIILIKVISAASEGFDTWEKEWGAQMASMKCHIGFKGIQSSPEVEEARKHCRSFAHITSKYCYKACISEKVGFFKNGVYQEDFKNAVIDKLFSAEGAATAQKWKDGTKKCAEDSKDKVKEGYAKHGNWDGTCDFFIDYVKCAKQASSCP